MIIVVSAIILLILFLTSVYVSYRICFGEYRENYPEDDVQRHMPKGPAYEAFREVIERGIRNVIEATEYETAIMGIFTETAMAFIPIQKRMVSICCLPASVPKVLARVRALLSVLRNAMTVSPGWNMP